MMFLRTLIVTKTVILSWKEIESRAFHLKHHFLLFRYVMFSTIWYHLCNLKIVKNTPGGMLLLVKLQASACNFTKSNTPPGVLFKYFELYRWYQIVQSASYDLQAFKDLRLCKEEFQNKEVIRMPCLFFCFSFSLFKHILLLQSLLLLCAAKSFTVAAFQKVIKIKMNLNYYHTSLWCLKRFYALHKRVWK